MGVFTNNILGLDIPVKQKTKKETKLLVNGSLLNYVKNLDRKCTGVNKKGRQLTWYFLKPDSHLISY